MQDIQISIKGFIASSQAQHFRFRYGIDLGLSQPTKLDGALKTADAFSGRNQITPYVGFDVHAGKNGIVGFKFSRQILFGEEVGKGPNDSTVVSRGAEPAITSIFYEYQSDSWIAGLSFNHTVHSDFKDHNNPHRAMLIHSGVNAYSVVSLSESVVLLPSLGYTSTFSDSFAGSKINTFSILNAALGARFTF